MASVSFFITVNTIPRPIPSRAVRNGRAIIIDRKVA